MTEHESNKIARAERKFEAFCKSNQAKDPELEECQWTDLSIGFFLALGLTVDQAVQLATEARYDHCYWQ